MRKVLAYLTGLSFFYFFPLFWHFKPFDIVAIIYFLLSLKYGFKFYKYDILFYLFLVLSYASLINVESTTILFSSLLQNARYAFYFFLARINTPVEDKFLILSGIKISFWLAIIYIILDVFYYYTIGNCSSINTALPFIPEDKALTHRSDLVPIQVSGCLYYRFTGPAWDPGGIYPIMLIFGAFLIHYKNKSLFYHISGILGVFAVSRTTALAYIWTMIYRKLKFSFLKQLWLYSSLLGFMFFLPAFFYMALEESSIYLDEGTARHVTYPALAFLSMIENPLYLLIGEGLRGGRNVLYNLSYVPHYFFEYEEKDILVVESIWVNYITGAGLFGFIFYILWLLIGFRNMLILFLALFMAGLFYSFDSSQYCFIVPFFMTLKQITLKNSAKKV